MISLLVSYYMCQVHCKGNIDRRLSWRKGPNQIPTKRRLAKSLKPRVLEFYTGTYKPKVDTNKFEKKVIWRFPTSFVLNSDPIKVYQWSICNFQKLIDDIKMTFLKSFHKPILQLSKEQFSWIHKIFRRFTAIALRCRFVEKRFKLSDDFVAQRFWRFVEDDVVQRSQIPERSLLIYRRQFEQRRTKLLWKL